MEEKRKHERYQENLEIRIIWQGNGTFVGKTRDFSDGGTFITVDYDPRLSPGTEVNLQLNSLVAGKEAPVLNARVVRTEPDGIAFEFINL
ncbi:MAG TPA: PilZ domain-containing protein [Geobacteraceae bacterium]|nr:PilZ domain-containing protein [Geobacteraceae bacterium]